MTDRGQLTSTPIPVVLGVVLVVAVLVFNEAQSQLATADGAVNFCGLCHVDWRPTAALLVIGVVIAVASWALGVPTRPAGDGDE